MTIQLTPTQQAILTYAHRHTEGKITWYPDNIKGGARQKVIDGLSRRGLITHDGQDWFVAAEGYDALGVPRKAPINIEAVEEVIQTATSVKPRSRENSKQAQVIAMLQRPEGATLRQIMDTTGWQAHTVRGTLAGALKKKLGLTIVSEKSEGGERVYRLA